MRAILFLVTLALMAGTLAAGELDPGYAKAFGKGVIIASGKGYPAIGKYDPALFDYRDGTFFIKGGEEATVDLRVLFPVGVNQGTAIAKVRKEQPGNVKHLKDEISVWKIWCDHDYGGALLVDDKHPWPKTKKDEPTWAEPLVEQIYNASPESKKWESMGCTWVDLRSSLASTLSKVPAGTRFYVTLQFGYKYLTPGGQMETKWDDVYRKWVQVRSQGLQGYALSDPVAVCTFEIAGE